MKPALLIDQTYHWQGNGDGLSLWQSFCRLQIFQPHPEQTIVIVSDPGGDCGTTITNCAEFLATRVVQEFAIDPATLTWIEHLPQSDVPFSLVEFIWEGKKAVSCWWKHLPKEKVEQLVGKAIQ